MEHKAEEFKKWMDQRKLTARDVAISLQTAEQTIRQWRSFGIPARRKPHVELFMKEWDESQTSPKSGQNLVLQPTPEQFDQWSQAALKQRKTVHQWAIDGLEALAENTETDQDIALVAEEVIKYNNQKLPKTA